MTEAARRCPAQRRAATGQGLSPRQAAEVRSFLLAAPPDRLSVAAAATLMRVPSAAAPNTSPYTTLARTQNDPADFWRKSCHILFDYPRFRNEFEPPKGELQRADFANT